MSDQRFEVAAHYPRKRDHDYRGQRTARPLQGDAVLHVLTCSMSYRAGIELAGIGAEEARRVSANEALGRTTGYGAEGLDLFRECRRADRRRDHGGGVRTRRSLPGLPRDNEGAGAGCLLAPPPEIDLWLHPFATATLPAAVLPVKLLQLTIVGLAAIVGPAANAEPVGRTRKSPAAPANDAVSAIRIRRI